MEKNFGVKLAGKQYTDRIGAYGIIFSEDNKVAVVRTLTGSYLIGGGVENSETYEECLKRECLEETGFDIEIKEFICISDSYVFLDSYNMYIHPIGYFYIAELKEKMHESIEKDHQLEWVSIEELEEKISLDWQLWPVQQACRNRMR